MTKIKYALATVATLIGGPALAQDNSPNGIRLFADEVDQALQAACPIPTADIAYPEASIACAKEMSLQAYTIAARASNEARALSVFTKEFQINALRCENVSRDISERNPTSTEMSQFISDAYDASFKCISATAAFELLPTINYSAPQSVVIRQMNCYTNPEGCVRPNSGNILPPAQEL